MEDQISIRQTYKKINYIRLTSFIQFRDKPQMSFVLVFTDIPQDKVCVIQGDQKVSVRLMITIQQVTSNVKSVPRQSPDIY
jgi:hypothetical protein